MIIENFNVIAIYIFMEIFYIIKHAFKHKICLNILKI